MAAPFFVFTVNLPVGMPLEVEGDRKEENAVKKRLSLWLALLLTLCALPAAAEWTEDQLLRYYEGALFVGDSISRQFQTYLYHKKLDDPSFVWNVHYANSQSYSLYSASRKNLLKSGTVLNYKGKDTTLVEVVRQTRPEKMLILLGVNDYAGENIEKHIGYCGRILELTRQVNPETKVFFFSLTPVTKAFCKKRDYRSMWDDYNAALEAFCAENGAGYVDIASPMKDADGYLKTEYTSDGKYHLSPAGLQSWLESLADYAGQQAEMGLWTPGET